MAKDHTDKDIEAVRRLRMYFRNSPLLVSEYGASDQGFILWIESILKVIRSEDMKRVKQILKGGENIETRT
jgi:hypothetical protein